jgi:hypothetical protein
LIDPLHLAIALWPLAAYLVVLGGLHLGRRPRVVGGARDAAALALALAGMVVAGPMELFFPEEATALYGGWVWTLLLTVYGLLVLLGILLMRPRIVVYNVTLEQLRPVVVETVSRLDSEARWAGDAVLLPQRQVQMHLEVAPLARVVQLVATGPQQDLGGWRALERQLRVDLRKMRTRPHPLGVVLLVTGLTLAAIATWSVGRDPGGTLQAFHQMVRS